MAVIGNADHSLTQSRFRHVGLAAIDHRGEVAAGDVSSRLLLADDLAPFGVRLDADVVASTFASTWEHSDTVLVELSDLERAEAARRSSTPDQARSQFAEAVSRSDELVGRLLDHVDLTRDLVMVVAPTIAGTNPGVTVFGATGAGMPRGWARSASTRRDGYVELTDIASTVLRNFGIAVPEAVNDTPILGVRRPSEPLDARIASMARDGGHRSGTRRSVPSRSSSSSCWSSTSASPSPVSPVSPGWCDRCEGWPWWYSRRCRCRS